MKINDDIILTIFTPTYNRAHTLKRGYEALLRQSNKNFIWLIVDDGSSDNTKELVNKWTKNNNGFEIKYIYKGNGGLHTAYNVAIEAIDTELCTCVDSDDFMPDDAVEKIISFWEKNRSKKYAGIVGLDFDLNNNTIGDPLPNQKSVNLIDLLIGKYNLRNGDRKNIVRTDLYKEVAPMKSFGNEKNFNPHYMHLQISKNYDFLILNENLCYVDYQEGGMTNSIFKQYYNSPKSFAEIRRLYMSFKNAPLRFKFRQAVHYDSSCILSKDYTDIVRKSPQKLLTFICILPGLVLSAYIKNKVKDGR